MNNSGRARPIASAIAFVALVALFGGLYVDAWHQVSKGNWGAFDTYFRAAQSLREGQSPYQSHSGTYEYVYPPLFALLCRPLLMLPELSAARLMLSINLSLCVIALLAAAGEMQTRLTAAGRACPVALLSLTAAIIVLAPLHNELRGLETNALMLLCFVLALRWMERRPASAGLVLALAIGIKYLPLAAIPYLLFRNKLAVVAATLIWTIALALSPALVIGWSANDRDLQVALSGLLHLGGVKSETPSARVHGVTDESSVSVVSGLARIAAARHLPKAAALLGVAILAAGGMNETVRAYRSRGLPWRRWPQRAASGQPFQGLLGIEWSGLVIAILAFSPNTQNRHLVLAVIPASLVAVLLYNAVGAARRLASASALIMLAGLALPVAAQGKPFTRAWLGAGMPCWCLLASYAAVLWAAVEHVRVITPSQVEALPPVCAATPGQ